MVKFGGFVSFYSQFRRGSPGGRGFKPEGINSFDIEEAGVNVYGNLGYNLIPPLREAPLASIVMLKKGK